MKKLPVAAFVLGLLCLGLAVEPGLAARVQSPTSAGQWERQAVVPDAGIARTAAPLSSTSIERVEEIAPMSFEEQNQTIGRFCIRCHNDTTLEGGMSLESFDAAKAYENADVAEKMIRKLRAGMMPPRPSRRPDDATVDSLVAALEGTIDSAAALQPNPGTRTFQRLNRAEYASSVSDLLGLDIDVGTFLPLDTKSASFDNIADVQMPSATLMEGYLRASGHISRVAVGDPEADASSTSYRVPRTASQKDHVDGAPFGTRGGLAVIHNFPADGKYVFQTQLHAAPEGELFGRTSLDEKIEVSIDGERVSVASVDRWMSESDPAGMTISSDEIYVRAGPHRVAAAFVRLTEGPDDDLITPIDHTLADTQIGLGYGVTTMPHLRELAIVGPSEVTGVSDTPTRQLIFSCRPTAADEETPCAESILGRLARRAYRRPLRDNDVASLMTFYNAGSEHGGFEAGIRMALQAVLASPHFVFRMEEAPSAVNVGDVYEIGDVDLASRLSFFLWGAPPDAELVELADLGELSEPEMIGRQVKRMLADPRAEALASRFAAQWLRLQDLEKVHPDALAYPYFDYTLSEAMHRETEMLFAHLIREDRNALELLTADYTFVNERLARHYGIRGVNGSEFRRVAYPDDRRRGVLAHASILTLTSHANRTSPVLRGKWVMEVLLGSPPPPPPADVPDLEATGDVQGARFLSAAEQLAEHRANPACSSCHNVIDPIGLAFENFDLTGAWRIKDRGVAVDASGELYDGTQLNGLGDLRQALLARSDVVLTHFAESLMAYALGRRVEYYDMPTIREIVRQAEANGNRMSSFIVGIAQSPAFRMSRMSAPASSVAGSGSDSRR